MNEKYMVGTCEEMCSASEIALRKINRLVHFYEISSSNFIFIKEFSRSAADKKNEHPKDLRTFGALKKTLEFLFNK